MRWSVGTITLSIFAACSNENSKFIVNILPLFFKWSLIPLQRLYEREMRERKRLLSWLIWNSVLDLSTSVQNTLLVPYIHHHTPACDSTTVDGSDAFTHNVANFRDFFQIKVLCVCVCLFIYLYIFWGVHKTRRCVQNDISTQWIQVCRLAYKHIDNLRKQVCLHHKTNQIFLS